MSMNKSEQNQPHTFIFAKKDDIVQRFKKHLKDLQEREGVQRFEENYWIIRDCSIPNIYAIHVAYPTSKDVRASADQEKLIIHRSLIHTPFSNDNYWLININPFIVYSTKDGWASLDRQEKDLEPMRASSPHRVSSLYSAIQQLKCYKENQILPYPDECSQKKESVEYSTKYIHAIPEATKVPVEGMKAYAEYSTPKETGALLQRASDLFESKTNVGSQQDNLVNDTDPALDPNNNNCKL